MTSGDMCIMSHQQSQLFHDKIEFFLHVLRVTFCLRSWWLFWSIWRGARDWQQHFLLLRVGVRIKEHIFLRHACAVVRLSSATDSVWKRLDQCYHSSVRYALLSEPATDSISRVVVGSMSVPSYWFYFAVQ